MSTRCTLFFHGSVLAYTDELNCVTVNDPPPPMSRLDTGYACQRRVSHADTILSTLYSTRETCSRS